MPTMLPRVQVTLTSETYKAIKVRSKKEKVSMSKIIVAAIEKHLKEGN